MKAQLYKVSHQGDEIPKEGSFVHLNDDDDIVRGFVSKTTDDYCEICTFEPIETSDISNLIEVTSETLPKEVVLSKLQKITEQDEEVRQMWEILIREAKNINVNKTG